MRKAKKKSPQGEPPRILARILAEDLRNIRVTGAGGTIEETGTPHGAGWDFTNYGKDGDVY